MKAILLSSIFFVSGWTVYAQDTKVEPPKTKLQAFGEAYGRVYIKGYSKIGTVKGLYGGSVTVETKEFIDASSGKKEYGVSLEVKRADNVTRDHMSYVDYEEIPSLVKGLEYIGKIDKAVTKLEGFEAEYNTKDDLEFTAFGDEKDIKLAVKSGNIGSVTAYFRIEDLQKVKELIEAAKQKIDSIK